MYHRFSVGPIHFDPSNECVRVLPGSPAARDGIAGSIAVIRASSRRGQPPSRAARAVELIHERQ